MAIFNQIPRAELGTRYTHYGWLCGICPVYLADLNGACPTVAERNWVPEWWLWVAEYAFGTFVFMASLFNDAYEPMYPIFVGDRINLTKEK